MSECECLWFFIALLHLKVLLQWLQGITIPSLDVLLQCGSSHLSCKCLHFNIFWVQLQFLCYCKNWVQVALLNICLSTINYPLDYNRVTPRKPLLCLKLVDILIEFIPPKTHFFRLVCHQEICGLLRVIWLRQGVSTCFPG